MLPFVPTSSFHQQYFIVSASQIHFPTALGTTAPNLTEQFVTLVAPSPLEAALIIKSRSCFDGNLAILLSVDVISARGVLCGKFMVGLDGIDVGIFGVLDSPQISRPSASSSCRTCSTKLAACIMRC